VSPGSARDDEARAEGQEGKHGTPGARSKPTAMLRCPHHECDDAAARNKQRDGCTGSELAHRTGESGGRIERLTDHRILSSVVYHFRYTTDAELHVNSSVAERPLPNVCLWLATIMMP